MKILHAETYRRKGLPIPPYAKKRASRSTGKPVGRPITKRSKEAQAERDRKRAEYQRLKAEHYEKAKNVSALPEDRNGNVIENGGMLAHASGAFIVEKSRIVGWRWRVTGRSILGIGTITDDADQFLVVPK